MAPLVEIAIPSTSTSNDAKPFTLYNITLRLPLRSFTVQKRYSDFVALHHDLATQAAAVAPVALPQKSWFKRTTASPELTEERRQGLEAYLRKINDAADGRWRGTSAWRAFLNLPSTTANAASSRAATSLHGNLTSPSGGGAPITDPTVWLDCHRDLRTQLHDARLHLQRRDQAQAAQAQHESAVAAKRCLVKAGGLIKALDQGLKALADADDNPWRPDKLGDGELRRRKDLVASARKEKEGLETLANTLTTKELGGGMSGASRSRAVATEQDKSGLLGTDKGPSQTIGGRSGRVLGAPAQETEQTRELDNQGILQMQKDMMEDQDLTVEELTKGLGRLRQTAIAINDELEVQKDLISLLDEDVERFDSPEFHPGDQQADAVLGSEAKFESRRRGLGRFPDLIQSRDLLLYMASRLLPRDGCALSMILATVQIQAQVTFTDMAGIL
ncbi:MAG: hypothetical protein M1825_006345 [Sarcosagium campestre]|nr:MAG: hypothetical protein M1825_006345 [Sarcosagium campestre]